MSTINSEGSKIVLPRTGPDLFWRIVHQYYADEDAIRWKYLAMLALRENSGWPLEYIGKVFDHPKGHVSRSLKNIKQELRRTFRHSPPLDLPEWEELLAFLPPLEDEVSPAADELSPQTQPPQKLTSDGQCCEKGDHP